MGRSSWLLALPTSSQGHRSSWLLFPFQNDCKFLVYFFFILNWLTNSILLSWSTNTTKERWRNFEKFHSKSLNLSWLNFRKYLVLQISFNIISLHFKFFYIFVIFRLLTKNLTLVEVQLSCLDLWSQPISTSINWPRQITGSVPKSLQI